MQQADILNTLTEIWRDQLDNEDITLRPETTARNVKGWDSLTNIQLIVATEKKFKIRFSAAEIMAFTNVGELADMILKKLK